ncbi:MAG: PqqD family protein [Verrucomicrobiales bacterium]|nr:PqqD family protein [Verrucomicrobiales bacterium]
MTYQITADQVASRILDGEAVLIHYGSSEYFSLNRAGTWVWEALDASPRADGDVSKVLSAHFQLDESETGGQIQAFFRELEEAGLISSVDQSQAEAAAVQLDASGIDWEYDPPQLTKCGDLETLILSGE